MIYIAHKDLHIVGVVTALHMHVCIQVHTHTHALTNSYAYTYTHTHTHARAARACIHMHNLPVHIHERLTVFTFFAAYPTSRSLTPEPQSPAPAGPLLEIITDEQGLLHLTGLPETTSRSSVGNHH